MKEVIIKKKFKLVTKELRINPSSRMLVTSYITQDEIPAGTKLGFTFDTGYLIDATIDSIQGLILPRFYVHILDGGNKAANIVKTYKSVPYLTEVQRDLAFNTFAHKLLNEGVYEIVI